MRGRLLLIEDDEAFRNTLARALRRLGWECSGAGDGNSALQALDPPPAGIVLDLRLGADNGLQLVVRIRERAPVLPLLLTGYASIATAVEAIRLGASDYRPKPCSAEDVVRALFPEDAPVAAADIPDTPIHPRRLQWEHLQRVLAEHAGNVSAAARALGLHRRSLQRKLAQRPIRER